MGEEVCRATESASSSFCFWVNYGWMLRRKMRGSQEHKHDSRLCTSQRADNNASLFPCQMVLFVLLDLRRAPITPLIVSQWQAYSPLDFEPIVLA